jgi:hypothetical protein
MSAELDTLDTNILIYAVDPAGGWSTRSRQRLSTVPLSDPAY